MESRTKVKLSRDEIEVLVQAAFNGAVVESTLELKEGWFNTAYHISLEGGKRQCVLKIGPPADADILSYEMDLMRAEVGALKRVAGNPLIPVPRVQHSDFSRKLVPYDYYFMEFVDGQTWNRCRETLTDDQNHLIEWQLGRITAAINTYQNPTFGYYASGPVFEKWANAFRWMASLLFEDARRYDISLELSEAYFFEKYDQYSCIFDEIECPQLVHWDLWAGNIFVKEDDEGVNISGIVDFERALWGDPLMEAYLGRLNGISQFFEGYGSSLLKTKEQRLRRVFYNIYLHMIMIIEDGPRQYDDKTPVRWAEGELRKDLAMLENGDTYL